MTRMWCYARTRPSRVSAFNTENLWMALGTRLHLYNYNVTCEWLYLTHSAPDTVTTCPDTMSIRFSTWSVIQIQPDIPRTRSTYNAECTTVCHDVVFTKKLFTIKKVTLQYKNENVSSWHTLKTNPSHQGLVHNYMTQESELVDSAVLLMEARFGCLRESLTFLHSL